MIGCGSGDDDTELVDTESTETRSKQPQRHGDTEASLYDNELCVSVANSLCVSVNSVSKIGVEKVGNSALQSVQRCLPVS